MAGPPQSFAPPTPMVPESCDLRDLPSIMLDRSIATSNLGMLSTGDEFKAAILLYEAAYDQQPAGSLPREDQALAFLSRAASKWSKVRSMALRGWIECSDGRLYHPVTAEKVLVVWISRLRQRLRSKAGGAKKNGREISDGDILQDQITDALTCLERVAPGNREVIKWRAQVPKGSATGTATGTTSGAAEALPTAPLQAVPDECQGEAEGKGKEEGKSPSQDETNVIKLGTTRGAAA